MKRMTTKQFLAHSCEYRDLKDEERNKTLVGCKLCGMLYPREYLEWAINHSATYISGEKEAIS